MDRLFPTMVVAPPVRRQGAFHVPPCAANAFRVDEILDPHRAVGYLSLPPDDLLQILRVQGSSLARAVDGPQGLVHLLLEAQASGCGGDGFDEYLSKYGAVCVTRSSGRESWQS